MQIITYDAVQLLSVMIVSLFNRKCIFELRVTIPVIEVSSYVCFQPSQADIFTMRTQNVVLFHRIEDWLACVAFA